MNEPFEYKPLEHVFSAFEASPEEEQHADLIRCLESRGLNPVKTTAEVKGKVAAFLKAQRLSWRDVAKQNQDKLTAATARVKSWTLRKREEIEKAFTEIQLGTYGPTAQMKLQAAHRNLANISLADKANFLDDIDVLCELHKGENTTEPES